MKSFKAIQILIFIFSLTIPGTLLAQPQIRWTYIFDKFSLQDVPYDIAIDKQGNTYVCGFTEWTTFPQSNFDYLTLKFDSSGNKLWDAQYDGPSSRGDIAHAIAVDDSGNVFVTGTAAAGGWTGICTIKYNSNGEQQWVSIYTGETGFFENMGESIALDKHGNIYVTGTTVDWNIPENRLVTIKYNKNGSLLWKEFYTDSLGNNYWGQKVLTDSNSDIFILGQKQTVDNIKQTILLKYSGSGELQWKKEIPNVYGVINTPVSFVLDPQDNAYVSASSVDANLDHNYLTAKYTNSGHFDWLKKYSGEDDMGAMPYAICSDGIDGIYVTGTSVDTFHQGPDLITIPTIETLKYDTSGSFIWSNTFETVFDTILIAVDLDYDANQNVYALVYATKSGAVNEDVLMLKYDPAGNTAWHLYYDYNGFQFPEQAIALKVFNEDDFVFTARFNTANATFDILTVRYSPNVLSVDDQILNDESDYYLYQNYPNPFNPTTKIKFTIPQSPLLGGDGRGGLVTLKVYDVLGKEVATLVNEQKPAGTYEVVFNAGSLSSGIYFYKLQAGNFMQMKKMILLK